MSVRILPTPNRVMLRKMEASPRTNGRTELGPGINDLARAHDMTSRPGKHPYTTSKQAQAQAVHIYEDRLRIGLVEALTSIEKGKTRNLKAEFISSSHKFRKSLDFRWPFFTSYPSVQTTEQTRKGNNGPAFHPVWKSHIYFLLAVLHSPARRNQCLLTLRSLSYL